MNADSIRQLLRDCFKHLDRRSSSCNPGAAQWTCDDCDENGPCKDDCAFRLLRARMDNFDKWDETINMQFGVEPAK